MAPKARRRRHTRSSDIPVASKMMASNGPTISPRPCMEKTSDTIRPRLDLLAYSLMMVALTG